ncbi:TauD/TfdA family dioxygenase, partial [Caballeronia terrestris]|uniref:TauD/TfdA family dioxygenase n=1 Tax=Caballeronia terrestris TaxID=1226301 RepID=UPI00190EF837
MLDTAYETITAYPLTRHIGAQIGGIDLTRPLSAQQVADVRRALLAHQVIFFRDQPISLDQHLALGRYFGALHVHPNSL